jgi:broad-specificity NMP kinase
VAERILITGGPRTGKTTLARSLSPHARSTDDVIHLGWSEASAEVATWFDRPGPWVIEGVAVPRALRKWLEANPHVKVGEKWIHPPCDRIIFLSKPHERLSKGQSSMAAGVLTVWREIAQRLHNLGVALEER